MTAQGAAVVGTGFIGPVHVEAIRRLGHTVVGILGSSPEKSRAAAQALHLERAYGSLEELLADPAVHVVHIASPNREHFSQCQSVLKAGKHLICEKPLAMTPDEALELVRLAGTTPVISAVNYNVRFYPQVLEARARIRSGEVGAVYHITGSYLQDWLLYPTDYNWRVDAEAGGALRAIADIGTHWLDTIAFITGLEIEAVCADLQTVHSTRNKPTGPTDTFTGSAGQGRHAGESVPITTEDAGHVLLKFTNGARGSFSVSQVTAGRKNCIRFDIAAAEASLSWDSEEPNLLHIGYRHRANEALTRDPALLSDVARPYANYPGGHAEGFPDSFKQLYRAVYDAVAHGPPAEPLYATFADGYRELLLCDAILTSHREQCWVPVQG